MASEKHECFQGLRRKESEQSDVQSMETLTHNTVMVDTCHCTFVQTCNMCNTKIEPHAKYGFGMINMRQ